VLPYYVVHIYVEDITCNAPRYNNAAVASAASIFSGAAPCGPRTFELLQCGTEGRAGSSCSAGLRAEQAMARPWGKCGEDINTASDPGKDPHRARFITHRSEPGIFSGAAPCGPRTFALLQCGTEGRAGSVKALGQVINRHGIDRCHCL